MNDNVQFRDERLCWLEELDPEYFVKFARQENGKGILETSDLPYDMVQLKALPKLIEDYDGQNLWRSWSVYRNQDGTDEIGPVPLVLDFDTDDDDINLEEPYEVVRACLDVLLRMDWVSDEESLKIVFSGRKGFHVEIKPMEPLEDLQNLKKKLVRKFREKLDQPYLECEKSYITDNIVLDPIDPIRHPWLRLVGSLYSWNSNEGHIRSRRVFKMTPKEFRSYPMKEILQISERRTKQNKK